MTVASDILRQLTDPGTAAALSQGATALDALPGLQGQVSDLTAKNAALTAQVAELEAELHPTPAPVPKTGLVLGLDTTSFGTLAAQKKMLGVTAVPNIRVFFSAGQAPSWTVGGKFANLTPADRPFISCKTLTEATLTAFLDAMPAAWKQPGAIYKLCYFHECEADILKSADPAGGLKGYLATYDMIARVLAQHPNGKFFEAWKILLRYSQVLDPACKDSWSRFVGGQQVPVGMDCYWEKQFPTYDSPQVLFAKLLEIHAATGLRVGVPEWGGITVGGKRNDPDGSKRAAAIAAGIAYLRATPIEFASWWNGTGAAGDHRLDPFPSNVAAWAAGMAANPAV